MRAREPFDGYWPGVLGGLVAVAAALFFRSAQETRLLAEVVVDATTYVLQARGFSLLLSLFGAAGKPLLFLAVLVSQIGLYVVVWRAVAVPLGRRFGADRGLAASAAVAAAVLVGATLALVSLPETGLGSQTTAGEYVIGVLLASLLYALAARLQLSVAATAAATAPAGGAAAFSRRAFLARLPSAALGGAALLFIGTQLLRSTGGGARRSHSGRPTPEVTLTEDFYVVSKNLIDPAVDAEGWRLRVGGLTRRMLELTHADILALQTVEQFVTLQCISNEVNGDLLSNAAWTGFPLRRLIEMAEPAAAASFVSFRCADDYTESLPLEVATREDVLLVHAMNGAPLTDKHGFPVRLLVPGKYGIKNPKWITEIGLIAADSLGYWESRGWSNEARMNTSCRIDVPGSLQVIAALPFRFHGVAFSGNRGISRVEVSLDGGASWREAVLRPALSPYTWVLWHYDLADRPAEGRVEIYARATDGTGQLQTAERYPPYPSGATGYPVAVARFEPAE